MSYYLFKCSSCGHQKLIRDDDAITYLIENPTHPCPKCGEENHYISDSLYDDDNWRNNPTVMKHPSKWGIHDHDFPTSMDMLCYYEDTEELELWKREVLAEFDNADDLTTCDNYGYPNALSHLKSHQFGWVKFGAWAFRFKLKRFYKRHYKTWKQFCEKILHKSHWAVDKIIKATRVVKDLLCAGFEVLPQNEYQCRSLTKFWGEELIDNWAMIVDGVPPHFITGDLIKSQFDIKEPTEEKWIKIDSQLWEEFEYKAHSRGLNPNHVIEDYLNEWEGDENEETTDELEDDQIEDVPIEKLKAWQDDLQTLIEEKDRADNWFTKLIFWSLTNERNTGFLGIP